MNNLYVLEFNKDTEYFYLCFSGNNIDIGIKNQGINYVNIPAALYKNDRLTIRPDPKKILYSVCEYDIPKHTKATILLNDHYMVFQKGILVSYNKMYINNFQKDDIVIYQKGLMMAHFKK